MESFLHEQKKRLINSDATVTAVLGNESCDLDSTISAVVFAYLIYKVRKYTGTVVPVLNVERRDLVLRTEVVYFLDKINFPITDLICKDEINLQALKDENRLRLVLVDHNVLCDEQSNLQENIVEIIDHHKVCDPEQINICETKIENVGSCCTLIAEEILKSPHLLTPQIALLLFGTIVMDTVCLQEEAKRVTPKDRDIVNQLSVFLENKNKEEIFKELQAAKFDISNLTPEQLLRKDTKYISRGSTSVAIASLPILLQGVVDEEEFLSALSEMVSNKNLAFIILLGSEIVNDGFSVKRQLAIFDKSQKFLKKVCKYLISIENPTLDLHTLPVKCDSILLFNQENSTLSRKFVLPAVQQYLATHS